MKSKEERGEGPEKVHPGEKECVGCASLCIVMLFTTKQARG
jgi:hypothetical protein